MLLALAFMLMDAPPAHAEQLRVSAADCRKLVTAVPSDDVEYKPGVDVHGNKVAPADIDGGYQNIVPEEITISIGIDLADRLGRAQARASGQPAITANRPLLPYAGGTQIGEVSVRGNDVFWNGQPLAPQDEAALAAACRAGGAAAQVPPSKPNPPNR